MASNSQIDQFSIGQEQEKDKPVQYDLNDVQDKRTIDPDVLDQRAEKYAFGTGIDKNQITQTLKNGGEEMLRDSVAETESLNLRKEHNKLLLDYAKKLNRPLTPEELDQVDTFTKLNLGVSPNSVLEESYGKAFSNLSITAARDNEVSDTVMSSMPDATIDSLDAAGRQIARREIAANLLEDLNQRTPNLGGKDAAGQFVKEIGQTALQSLNPFVGDERNRYSDTPILSYLTDYAQMWLPGYANVKIGGWHLDLGGSLAEQYREFMLMSPSEFKDRFTETVESIAEDNLPLAMQYAQGFMRYSTSDRILDQVFGYADWLSVAGTIAATGKVASNLAKGVRPLDKIESLLPKRGKETPPEPPMGVGEQIQHIKDWRNQLKATVKAANSQNAEDVVSNLGDLDAAATLKVHDELVRDLKGLDPFDDTLDLRGKTAGIFYPGRVGDDIGSLSRSRADKQLAHATAHANHLLRIMKNNHNVSRLTEEQINAAIEFSKERMLKDYNHINDAILDVNLGGPFRTYTPDEQLINVYTNEMRVGKLPEPPKVPSKTAIARDPNAVDNLLEYLRLEKTTHKNSARTRKEVVDGYNDLIQEFHSNPKGNFLEFINSEIGNGGLFDSLTSAIKERTGKPLTRGQLNRLQHEIGLGPSPTGDVFVDRINSITARRGKVLARDVYDSLKRQGKFDGTLGDFRKKLKELRRAKKLKMSAYKKDVLTPLDLPKPSEPRKAKPIAVEKVNTLKGQGELPLGDKTRPQRKVVEAVRDDFAQRLYDVIFSLRVGNPTAGAVKVKFPGSKRVRSFKNFQDMARAATATFRRQFDEALHGDILTPSGAQGLVNDWTDFTISTRERVPVKKGSKKLWAYNFNDEVAARSQGQKAQFNVDTSSLEEGNFSSEFKRDVGYGNETLRNRIIDSEIVTSKPTKTAGTRRVHYIDPPTGWGPSTKTKAREIPTRPQRYPQAKPENDSDLMLALTELQVKLSKTADRTLSNKIAKFLDKVERRNFQTISRPFGEDTRTLDLANLGSPYGNLPLPSETVERRVLTKKLPPGYRKITAQEFLAKRKAGHKPKTTPKTPLSPEKENDVGFLGLAGTTDAVTARKGVTDPAFVGRDYSKRPPLPASQRALSKADRRIYEALERDTYAYVNKLIDDGKTSIEIKMGKPSAVLFKKRDEAAYWGTEIYGLNPNQYRILQQGSGYYISIPRIVDETPDAIRDLRVATGNKVSENLATALMGWAVAPDNYVDDLSKLNRPIVTYAPQEMHRLIQEAAKEMIKLPKAERREVNEILTANRDYVFVDDENNVRRGRYNETFGDFEREFYDKFKKLPNDGQIAAYFDHIRYMDLDLALRDFHLVRDMSRLGYERTTLGYHVPTIDNKVPERATSKPFATKEIDELPFDTNNTENWGVFVYNPHTRQGDFSLRNDVTPEFKKTLADLTTNHGFKILQVGNPLEKPVRNIARTQEIVNFLVVKDFNRVKYSFSNIPKRPGGHIRYRDEIFIKQPVMRNTKSGWIYEGDETMMNFTSVAQAKKFVPRFERARKLLKEGREAELERYLAKNLPFDLDHFKSYFFPKEGPDGVEIPPRFSLDHEFTWTANGKNTFDMSHFKSKASNYKGFTNAIRSEYNDFAAYVDKKFLGHRDPDVPAMGEFKTPGRGEPAFVLAKPRLIDPSEMINSSLSNIIRSRYLNDMKLQAADQFIEQFYPVMKTPLEEMRRNPIFYLHNPVWDTSTDNLGALMAGKHYRQASLHLIGTDSTLGKAMNYVYEKMTDGIYKRSGQHASDKFTEIFYNAKNPIDLARGGVFHEKLGLLNPVQYLVQSSSMTYAASIKGWGKVYKAYPKMWAARLLNLTEDPKMIEGMAKFMQERMSKIGGFNADEFIEGFNELKKTGFYNVGGEYANRNDFFDPKVFGSKTGKFLDKTAFFFTEGERAQRIVAWFVAFDEWKAANSGKIMNNVERAKVLEQAHFLTGRMARNSNANIQNGSLSVTFQFMSYQWRMAEAILGKSLTGAQKRRVLLTNAALWGVPVAASSGLIYPFYDDVRQYALENGWSMDNLAVKSLHDGLVSTVGYLLTGETYNFGERYGPSGLSTVKELFQDTGPGNLLEFLGGAVGSVAGDMIATTDPVYNAVMQFFDPTHAPPTTGDFVEFFRNISSVNNAYRAWYLANTRQYFTKNDTLVTEDGTSMDAIMSLFAGVSPTDVNDTFLMLKSLKEQKEAQQIAKNEAAKYLRRMMRNREDSDWEAVDANLRLAKAALEAAKIPPKEWQNVLRQAYKGHESLFERALKKFVQDAPVDQFDARKQRAMEKLDKVR